MVIEKLFVIDLQKVNGRMDRKICAVGTAKILSECQFLLSNEANLKVWASLLEALVGLFELPEELTGVEEDNFIDTEETPGYQSAFNQLHSASRRDVDPFENQISDAKFYLAGQLKILSGSVAFSVGQLLGNLSIESQKHLQAYLSQANVQLN